MAGQLRNETNGFGYYKLTLPAPPIYVRSGQVIQRKRLNRKALMRYIQEQAEPVEWVIEAYDTSLLGPHNPVPGPSALLATQRCQARTQEKLAQLQRWAVETAARIDHNKAAVPLANKLVRICWAVWCNERRFSGDWQSVRPA